jgi:hypothetical protein
MVDRADGEIRLAHPQPGGAKSVERPAAGALLRKMAVDEDQRAAVAVILDHVLVPDALEWCVGHGLLFSMDALATQDSLLADDG